MKKPILLLLAALLAATGYAQPPFVFKSYDLDPGGGFSSPASFVNFKDKFYFTAYSPSTSYELWVGDSSAGGIKLLKDLWPGSGSKSGSPAQYTVSGGKLFFIADGGVSGRQLWVSDGTAAGTRMINVNVNFPINERLCAYNGGVIFNGNTSTNGIELWISDGTDAGTKMIKDIYPGSNSSDPDHFFEFSGFIYFSATDAAHYNELWVTDGTASGIVLVKDINPGAVHSFPSQFCVNGSKFYFSAYHASYGYELWESDGSPGGTKLLKDISTGTDNSLPGGLTVYNGKVYFSATEFGGAGHELWVTDGTTAGTILVKDIYPGGYSSPQFLTEYNGKLYFQATDTSGEELWSTDGTAAGTTKVKDIYPGATGSLPTRLFVYKTMLYFRASLATGDVQLFQSDGTNVGTRIIAPSSAVRTAPLSNTWEFFMYPIDSTMYFAADYDAIDFELWSLKDTTKHPPLGIKNTSANEYICQGDSFYVPVMLSDSFDNLNVFRVQLSDSSGLFSLLSPFIGSDTGRWVDSIKCAMPALTIPGTKYRLRLHASSPAVVSYSSPYDITVDTTLPVTASITVHPLNHIVAGDKVTFRSADTNAGATPYYQWCINGIKVPGANADSFVTTTLKHNDSVSLMIHSSLPCSSPDTVKTNVIGMLVITDGITGAVADQRLLIYPNPTDGVVNIFGPGFDSDEATVELVDVTGRVLQRSAFAVNQGRLNASLSLNAPTDGIYILRVQANGYNVIKSIVVKH